MTSRKSLGKAHISNSRHTAVKSRRRKKRRIKNLDLYVMTALLYIIAWSVAFFIAWLAFQNEPSVLEGCILTPGVVELVVCAWIKTGKKEDTSQENGEIE